MALLLWIASNHVDRHQLNRSTSQRTRCSTAAFTCTRVPATASCMADNPTPNRLYDRGNAMLNMLECSHIHQYTGAARQHNMLAALPRGQANAITQTVPWLSRQASNRLYCTYPSLVPHTPFTSDKLETHSGDPHTLIGRRAAACGLINHTLEHTDICKRTCSTFLHISCPTGGGQSLHASTKTTTLCDTQCNHHTASHRVPHTDSQSHGLNTPSFPTGCLHVPACPGLITGLL